MVFLGIPETHVCLNMNLKEQEDSSEGWSACFAYGSARYKAGGGYHIVLQHHWM